MGITRTLSGIAAGTVLGAGLALGLASPAVAAPPPVFPTCATMLPAEDFTPGHIMSGWSRYTPPTFGTVPYGASDGGVIALIRSHVNVTCTWTHGTKVALPTAASISEVTLTASDLKGLRAYYASIGVVGHSTGGPALDYAFTPAGHPTWLERHTVFPDGTVVFTLDRSGRVNGAMSQDAVEVLNVLNPWINR